MVYPARVRFAQLPTSIEKLDRLTRHLGGLEIYVKRDDQTGLALCGHAQPAMRHVVTLGGPQSNHVRQTAAGDAAKRPDS